ncbi:LOW QUALITY PROTEIN: hypothetical protein Cgig2_025795 [Carnegiea gigantea]|uniref:Uncharacterized protein n=1 Tax=Carnegiea gigantea TaxID=171969 RepID=A0A9Q1QGI4_9CARY|nr:LOW QUALITY PROTEIN: hypothetical protein Cgig2_025795 [Carnegiea gigantea]
MAPLEPKPPDPFIPCCLSCSSSQNLYLKSLELHGQIHRINYALKVAATRLALSQPSKLGLVIEVVHFHGVLGIQMLESGTFMPDAQMFGRSRFNQGSLEYHWLPVLPFGWCGKYSKRNRYVQILTWTRCLTFASVRGMWFVGTPNYIPKTFIQNAFGPRQIFSALYFHLAHKNSSSYCRKFMMLFGLNNYRRPLHLLSFVLFLKTADRIGVTSVVNQDKRMNCDSLTCYRHYPLGVANIMNPIIAGFECIPQIGMMLYSTLIWVCDFILGCHKRRLSDPLTSHENY